MRIKIITVTNIGYHLIHSINQYKYHYILTHHNYRPSLIIIVTNPSIVIVLGIIKDTKYTYTPIVIFHYYHMLYVIIMNQHISQNKERRINLGCTIHEKTTILRVAPEHMWFFCRFIILSFYVFFVYEILHAHVITYHHPNAGTGCRLLSRHSAATL